MTEGDGSEFVQALLGTTEKLRDRAGALSFGPPVATVYNPLQYAAESHQTYLKRHGSSRKRVIFLGMNPGPFGMVQTGVPFGEVEAVRDWLGITGKVARPQDEHPARPVLGFSSTRSEVSGRRLWGLFRERFGTAEAFFADHFVANFCPLAFMEESGRNLTPDHIAREERAPLLTVCRDALVEYLELWRPQWVIGVGRFAEREAALCASAMPTHVNVRVGTILHPSPASPKANKDWAGTANAQLETLGVW